MIATMKNDFMASNSKAFLLEIIENLNVEQIRILKYCYDKHGNLGYDFLRKIQEAEERERLIVSYEELNQNFRWESSSFERMGLISDLEGRGLLFDWSVGRFDYTPFLFALTDLGNELVKLLLKDETDEK